MNEIWKTVKGWEGLYEISSYGRVRKLDYIIQDSLGRKRKCKGYVTTGRIDSLGYPIIDLCKNGKQYRTRIHRLVAEAFLLNPQGYQYVNHKDLNKTNNRVDNLEWCTPKYNMVDAFDKGAFDKLCKAVRVIETGEVYKSLHQCALAIGGSVQNVSACLHGKRSSCNGYHFEKVEEP